MVELLVGLTSMFSKIANRGGSEPENSAKDQDLLNKINSGQYQARVDQEPLQNGPGHQVGGGSSTSQPTADEVRQARLARLDQQSAPAAEAEQGTAEPPSTVPLRS
mmetsp:Transcript_5275/g.12710  ORF Transcript_5275/g.12710 Transcript_5275/m.12710 type:complete len:106 (-) Transcript_5275:36-353(-)